MTDPEQTARQVLDELQRAVGAHDLEGVGRLFADEVAVFGTASESVDRDSALAYVGKLLAADDTIRWSWDTVLPLVAEPAIQAFAVLGSVGFVGADGDRDAFRLTCVTVLQEGRWRIRHFHGSVAQV